MSNRPYEEISEGDYAPEWPVDDDSQGRARMIFEPYDEISPTGHVYLHGVTEVAQPAVTGHVYLYEVVGV